MGMFKLLAIVAVAGLIGTLFRVLGVRATARPARPKRTERLKTKRGIGLPEGEGLQVWLPAGERLPATCKRVIRVSSSAGPVVPLSFHTDGPEMEALLDVELGPIDRSKLNVRLVQVTLKVSDAGRLKVTARVSQTRAVVPVKTLGEGRAVPVVVDEAASI